MQFLFLVSHYFETTFFSILKSRFISNVLLFILLSTFQSNKKVFTSLMYSKYTNATFLYSSEFPVFTKTPANITVHAGKTIHLPCAATGHPKPTISWRKDEGNTMFAAAEERRMVHHESRDMFLITDSKAKDMGFYTCSARNDAGFINATAYVIIRGEYSFNFPHLWRRICFTWFVVFLVMPGNKEQRLWGRLCCTAF
jgi:hypothetical protein